jgi:Ca2+-binding EF-hand superfamily protein
MRCVFTFSLVAGLALLCGVARADDDPGGKKKGKNKDKRQAPNLESVFKRLDADGDGKLTLQEFEKSDLLPNQKSKKAETPASLFTKLDESRDGALSLDEFRKISEYLPKKKSK